MNEQRCLPRWKIRKQVKLRLESFDNPTDCYLEDINLKGMCVSLSQRLPQDRLVKMELELSDNVSFEVHVQIPWIKESFGQFVHGAAFARIMDEDKNKVYE